MEKERIRELKKIVEESGAHWLGYCEQFDCVRFVKKLSNKQLNLRSTGLWRYEKVFYLPSNEVSPETILGAMEGKDNSINYRVAKRSL